jgi:putative tRNA adenosine deaminase-associated protein
VAYLGALLARTADGWQAGEVDLDTVDDLAGMAELMRDNAVDDDTVLLLVEQEDLWFGVVRLDGEDDPRVFVSDGAAVLRSAYSDLVTATLAATDAVVVEDDELEVVADLDEEDEDSVEGVDQVAPDTSSDDDDRERPVGPGPFGDGDILADLGLSAADLAQLCDGDQAPGDALGDLADALGAADELEAVR